MTPPLYILIFLLSGILGLVQSVMHEAWHLTFLSLCAIAIAAMLAVEKKEEKVEVNNLNKTKNLR